MDKTIIECNKLIAVFDGLEEDGRYWYRPTGNTEGLMYTNKYNRLEYHTSWDWLMPCIKKFNDMVKMEEIEHDMQSSALDDLMQMAMLLCNISDAHNYLSQLINWYNQQSKTNNNG